MKDNETIKEIRETRKKISARFDHDPKRLVEYYKEKQKKRMELNTITLAAQLIADFGFMIYDWEIIFYYIMNQENVLVNENDR